MACPSLVCVCWALGFGRPSAFISSPSPWIHTLDHSFHFLLNPTFFHSFSFHCLDYPLCHLDPCQLSAIQLPVLKISRLSFQSQLWAWQECHSFFYFTFSSILFTRSDASHHLTLLIGTHIAIVIQSCIKELSKNVVQVVVIIIWTCNDESRNRRPNDINYHTHLSFEGEPNLGFAGIALFVGKFKGIDGNNLDLLYLGHAL